MTNPKPIETQRRAATAEPINALEAAAIIGYLAAVAATVTLTALQVARLLVLNLETFQPVRAIAG